MTNLLKKKWITILTLAVMLVSLLAGFSVSGLFVPDGKKHYYISSASHWNTAATAANKNASEWDDVIFVLRGNLNFEDMTVVVFANEFCGTIEGNGYSIENAAVSGGGFFTNFNGTVRDLRIGSTCTITNSTTGASTITGSLAATVGANARIYNVASSAAVSGYGMYTGGIAGKSTSGATFEGCFFDGTLTRVNSTRKVDHAIKGSGTATICNSIGVYGSTARAYTTSASTYTDCASIAEAGWIVNQTGGAYFTYGYKGKNDDSLFKIGTARDHIVKTTINGVTSYNEPGDEITLTPGEGKSAVVTAGCAHIKNNVLYLTGISNNQNEVIVEYQDAEAVAKAQGKAEVEDLIAAFEDPNFDMDFFTKSTQAQITSWLDSAKKMVAADTSTGAQYHSKFSSGRTGIVAVDNTQYIPARYYSIYQYFPDVVNMSISTKEDWLALVEASNLEKLEITQYFNGNFAGLNKKFHLINDVEMDGEPMLPLCYGHTMSGQIDGHGYTLKNVNIVEENPFGSVGLVGTQAGTSVIQNLKVTGAITVTDKPIFNTTHVSADQRHEGNRVGGIAGQANKGSVIRKCLVDIDFSVKSAGNVGGILGDTRTASIVDGCIALGEFNGPGIVGEGANACKVYNSIYSGQSGIIKYHKNVMGNVSESMSAYIDNCYSFVDPIVWRGSWDGWNESTDALVADFFATHKAKTFQEAAYKVNQGYVSTGLGDGERIYYALDENGLPTFGDEKNQIIKITVVNTSGVKQGEYYANSNDEVDLFYTMGRNYYAVAAGDAVIKNKTLYTKSVGDLTLKVADNVTGGDAYKPKDGKVNLMDAQMVLRASVGLNEELVDLPAGDVNFNNKLDPNDAVLLVRFWLGDKTKYDPTDYTAEEGGWFTVASYNIKNLDWEGPAPVLKEGLETGNTYHSYATTGTTNHKLAPLADEVAAVINSVGGIDFLGLQEISQTTGTNGALHSGCSNCFSHLQTLNSKIDGNMNCSFSWASRSTGGVHYVDYGTAAMTPHTIRVTAREEYKNQYGPIYEQQLDGGKRNDERRVYGRLEVRMSDGTEIIWYNTHLGSMVEEQFAELMVEAQKDYAAGKKVIITADFNYWPTGMQKYLKGNFTMANGGEKGKNFESTTAVTGTAIDNIIISNNLEFYVDDHGSAFHVVDFGDLTAAQKAGCDQTWASDHNLVYAYVRVKPT